MTDAEYYATIELLQSDPEINQKWIALVRRTKKNAMEPYSNATRKERFQVLRWTPHRDGSTTARS
jgi:hypothetical protein